MRDTSHSPHPRPTPLTLAERVERRIRTPYLRLVRGAKIADDNTDHIAKGDTKLMGVAPKRFAEMKERGIPRPVFREFLSALCAEIEDELYADEHTPPRAA